MPGESIRVKKAAKPRRNQPAPEADGRRRRSVESRARIVAAMLALVREGVVVPGAEEVAARADVGLRTVFRHFDNMESLYREMDRAILREVMPIATAPYGAAGWRERLGELMARRAQIFERVLPVKTAAEAHQHTSPFIRRQARTFAAHQRAGLLHILPREIAGDAARVEALDLVLSFESWRRLRKEQGLSPRRAAEVIAALVAKLTD